MSGFEVLVIVLLIGGLILPIWALVATVHFANAKARHKAQSAQRCMAFTAVMDRLLNELRADRKRAPIVLACIRELQTFPEYRDISVTLINDINVSGNTPYDNMLRNELQKTEAFLLEAQP
ncbi:hypothetical protein [Aurantiacibacter poecillastricola]|uniref:hypothetical protein n=1 Tax=Aurantiacibacter poecillastricola TaxID=3064385 RepID=UPI00273DC643|nr:hypothetical protein [Aurantiacibacter sp. 219JJ12-13]MDP5262806.1 hypothetical protein [Aurantiacibacter sp. 219JJ12-13]